MYDVPRTREEGLGHLATEMEGRPIHLLRLDLSHEPGETLLLRRLEELFRTASVPEGKTPAVMVIGLEATIDFRPMPGTLFVEGGDLLRNANLQRDAFPERCPAPVVIWLNSAGVTAFTQTAPDLGQWCTGIFKFAGRETGRAELEKGLLSSPLVEAERLSHEAKRERIGLLQDLLLELEKSSQSEDPGSIARRAALHYELGNVFLSLSEAKAALKHLESSLELACRIGDRMMEGSSLVSLGIAQMSLGRIGQAIDYFSQALELAEQIGSRTGIDSSLCNLGIAHARLDELDQALDYLNRALVLSSESGNLQDAGRTLNNIGAVLMKLRRFDEAIDCLERALEIARASGDAIFISRELHNLGGIYHSRGRFIEALPYYEESLEIARKLGDRYIESRALIHLGRLFVELGQADRGIETLERAIRIGREIGDPEIVGSAEQHLRWVKELDPERLETTKA